MPLKHIIDKTCGPLGLNPLSSNDRQLLISKINFAASELWEQTDLVGSLREQLFEADMTEHELTLPTYVYQVRGVRTTAYALPIKVTDMAPRYYQGEPYQSVLSWRIKHKAALQRDIDNSAPMTISIPVADTARITFTVRGRTATSQRVTNQVTIEAGETEVDLTESFEEIVGFHKDRVTRSDCFLYDADGIEMAVIPNVMESSSYSVIQIADRAFDRPADSGNGFFEVLYKIPFIPFTDDYDEFPAGVEYDSAVIWKTLSHFYMTKEGEEMKAVGYEGQVAKLIGDKDRDASRGTVKPMNIYPNRFIRAMRRFVGVNFYGP